MPVRERVVFSSTSTGLCNEGVCKRWFHDPHIPHFTVEEFF
jgi:hypothetical protein